ncbi:glycosyltransferase [Candidatus Dependentiae bacterium]
MTSKKILVVGDFRENKHIYTYANSFYKIFLELDYKVEFFNSREKICSNLKLNNYLINLFLIRKVVIFDPEIVFFVKSENIIYKTIKLLKNKFKKKLINFYPDNPFCFWNHNSNSNVLKSLPLYDYFLSWSKMLMPVLESAGCKKVYYFPFAYDQNIYFVDNEVSSFKNYEYDVCFAGTWDLQREKILTQLCEILPDIKLGLWGNLWNKQLSPDSILRFYLQDNAVYLDGLISVFNQSKIILNFIRKQNMTSHNMRTFEVTATGNFLLTQRTHEQACFLFEEGKSIECFDGIEELVEKIKFYLKHQDLREEIAKNGAVNNFSLKIILKNFMSVVEQEGVKNEINQESKTKNCDSYY